MGAKSKADRRHFEACKARFSRTARDAYGGELVTEPVRVTVTVWYPDEVARDNCNFWKLIGDGLKGSILADDRWSIKRASLIEAGGVDRENPRAEVIVEPYERTEGRAA